MRAPTLDVHSLTRPEEPPTATLVLLAEDSPDVREMYRIWMELSKFRVIEAADGLEAIQLTQEHHPDAIVMDLSMPRVDGWEACRRLKANPDTRDIPIVALSAHAYADAGARAVEAGCDEFLPKPCTPDKLESCLRKLLPRRADPSS